jgi:thiol-disulfide isomerase/thioredoxin
MNKNYIIFLLLLISFSVFSQNVVVTGIAKGQPDKLIRIIAYSDQFSMLEHTIAQTKTNKLGQFTMEFRVDETQYAFIAFGLEKGEFYLSPGATYNFDIIRDTFIGSRSIFDRTPLNFILDANDGGVQSSIEEFNIKYNNFIYDNVKSIYKSKDKLPVTNFVSQMRNEYVNNDSEYVRNYVEYSLVSLLWLSRKESNNKVLDSYIVNKPALYNNIQYTDFFKEFFKSYFNSEKPYTYSELIFAINNSDPDVLNNLISQVEQLAADIRVREIVEMLLLERNYYSRDVKKELVLLKLKHIIANSSYVENRKIASDYIVELQKMQNGSLAPDLNLIDSVGDTVSLNKYRGKFILLSFVKPDCKICNFQMQLLKDIRKQLNNEFEIVTIVAGNNMDAVSAFAEQRGFNWPILKTGDDIFI